MNKKNWYEMKQLLINEEKRRGQQVLNDEQNEYFKGAYFEVSKLLEYMKFIEDERHQEIKQSRKVDWLK